MTTPASPSTSKMSDPLRTSVEKVLSNSKRFFKVVLTGGPCAGKTSALAIISDHFRNLGWHVFTCPEATTLMVSGGVSWAALNPTQWFNFQKNVMKTMIHLEDTYAEIALQREDDKPVLILCDRGVMDAAAYVEKDVFTNLLNAIGADSLFDVKHSRYDLVIHLVSAALGAEEHYSLENNEARTETPEEAREVDKRILQAWTGHPNIVCINNRTLFKEKIVRALQTICKRVGAPVVGDSTVKRKFLVSSLLPAMESLDYQDAKCSYTYLHDGDDCQQRLRKRKSEKVSVYTHIVRTVGESGEYERYNESSRNISRREYDSLSSMALADHFVSKITKRSFVFNSQYFSLVIFDNCHPGLMLLELYEEAGVEVGLPTPYMVIDSEVTTDPKYSMFNLSLREK